MLIPSLSFSTSEIPKDMIPVDILDSPLKENFERITRIAKSLFDVPVALVNFFDKDSNLFRSLGDDRVFETPYELSFCGHAFNQEDIINIPETCHDERFRNNPYVTGNPHVRFYAGCPIQVNNQTLGTFSIQDSKPRYFSEEQLQWLRDIAALVVTEIQSYTMANDKGKLALDLDQARMASMIDPLTGLWNRQGIFNILRQHMDEYLKDGNKFAVAILDIDHFKAINDTYGHSVGDITLKAISQILIKRCRDSDAIGRWGGEEFLLLINETNPKNMFDIAERMRSTIENQRFRIPLELTKKITVTIGLTSIEDGTKPSLEELIAKADKALYQGKKNGRNQVVRM